MVLDDTAIARDSKSQRAARLTELGNRPLFANASSGPGRAYAKLTGTGSLMAEMTAVASHKVAQDLVGIIHKKRKLLGPNAKPYDVMAAVIQDATVRQTKYDTVVHIFVGRTMNEIYDAANGDHTKVPTYEELTTLFANRSKRAWLEAHHTATEEWTRKLLKDLPQYQGYTPQQWNDLLEEMPAIMLSRIDHGNGEFAKGYGGFHEKLRLAMQGVDPLNSQDILVRLRTAYEQWGSTDGLKVWNVALDWLHDKGLP